MSQNHRPRGGGWLTLYSWRSDRVCESTGRDGWMTSFTTSERTRLTDTGEWEMVTIMTIMWPCGDDCWRKHRSVGCECRPRMTRKRISQLSDIIVQRCLKCRTGKIGHIVWRWHRYSCSEIFNAILSRARMHSYTEREASPVSIQH